MDVWKVSKAVTAQPVGAGIHSASHVDRGFRRSP